MDIEGNTKENLLCYKECPLQWGGGARRYAATVMKNAILTESE